MFETLIFLSRLAHDNPDTEMHRKRPALQLLTARMNTVWLSAITVYFDNSFLKLTFRTWVENSLFFLS